jgi:hypothetical protein
MVLNHLIFKDRYSVPAQAEQIHAVAQLFHGDVRLGRRAFYKGSKNYFPRQVPELDLEGSWLRGTVFQLQTRLGGIGEELYDIT